MVSPYLALAGFAVAASATPGPNNALVAATAASHGIRAAVPLVLGIATGFSAMLVVVALGVAGTLLALPGLLHGLRLVSCVWLALLAVRIARAGAPGTAAARPLRFLGAVAFQWVNPKAWFIALAASAAWVSPGAGATGQAFGIALVFFVVTLPSCALWALLGGAAGRWLGSPRRLRAFNVAMAALMMACMLSVAFGA